MIFNPRLKSRLSNEKQFRKTLRMISFFAVFLFAVSMQANAERNYEKDNLLKSKTTLNLKKVKGNGFTKFFKTITGTILDNSGNPLSGVSVTVKGSQKGTSTDGQGHFSLEANTGAVI